MFFPSGFAPNFQESNSETPSDTFQSTIVEHHLEMKLIVAGATGLVATEVINQCLQMPEITSIIALSRKPLEIKHINSSKLKTVIIKDYGIYPDEVTAQLASADACIWYAPPCPSTKTYSTI